MRVNNEYVKTKISEEKAKAKKPKLNADGQDKQLASKYEQLEYANELVTIVEKLLKTLPENIQPAMTKHLNIAFGLATEAMIRPPLGTVWNQIEHWPMSKKLPSQPGVITTN